MMRGPTIWLTGLPGAGKSTIATALADEFAEAGRRAEIIDGDVLRRGPSSDLGFSKADRDEQVRRAVGLAAEITASGAVVIVSLVSPYRDARDGARGRLQPFLEVHVDCPLDVLVARDPKGHYRDAIAGRLPHFTGVSDPYEAPLAPDLRVETDRESVVEAVARITNALGALERGAS